MVYGIKSLKKERKKERITLSISVILNAQRHLIGNVVGNAMFLFRCFLFAKDSAIRYDSG
ncbi:MAG: hypothetical protein IJ661_02450 [Lachnospiraceae bacterium]|nr:hypothetical protein [Lachnospiraceae bacterium]